ncbi:MAG: molybdopterin molybdotransferase MoeA [Spirochaetaceae bacterium]|nr:molybdopterin molybdotransferase MoeA [Spirochaetaceae bacterium]MDT8298984.1 molybdopterin molybdotransferase MoeA [Spirochaetaceae bacterium]
MIPFDRASELVLAESLPMMTQHVKLSEALGRFLAEKVASPLDAPPFDKSAMDGYAVRYNDERNQYNVREIVAAGDAPSDRPIEPGEAVQIMTGAPLPPDTGKIIRVEFTRRNGDVMTVTEPEPYDNIIKRASNIKAGDPLLAPCRLGAKEIGCLAAAGIPEVTVYRPLRVGIIITGDELRNAGSPLRPGEIYDSNGPQLSAQIINAGAVPVSYGIIEDDRDAHRDAVVRGLKESDILLLSGGVSKGEFDYVSRTLSDAGVDILFHGVKVKPGRPTLFGRTPSCLVFGLPGNPVSVFVQFEALVRPLINKLNQAPSPIRPVPGRLTRVLKRRDVDRAEFMPAVIGSGPEGLELTPLKYGGSSHLNALADANALIFIPAGTETLEQGDQVDARLL